MTDYTVGDTFYIAFSTRAFATGIPTVLAGTPVVSAYEDAGLTQITAGITLGVDHDSVVGLNMITMVATGGNGYESGKDYHLVITTGTVGGVSVVGEVVGRFTLGRSAAAVDLANGTDGLGAIKAETALIVADTNELQTDWANAGRLDVILDARMAEASINTTGGAVDTVTTNTDMRGTDSAATAAALATVDGNVDAILADTAEIGAAGDGLTAINLPNQTMDIVGNITGNLSGSVGSVTGAVGSVTGAVGSLTTNNDKTGYALSAAGVDGILDEVYEGTTTFRQFLRLAASALFGKLSGAATSTVAIRDEADSKDRITATVDADGNRTAVTLVKT